jgi:hypothetical protein
MTQIAIAPYQSNIVRERFIEHRKNLGFFNKWRIELNDIGKRVQSFFSQATCGAIANPYSLSNRPLLEMPYYFLPPTQAATDKAAHFFNAQRSETIGDIQQEIKEKMVIPAAETIGKSEGDDSCVLYVPEERDKIAKEKAEWDHGGIFLVYALPVAFDTAGNNKSLQEAAFESHYAKPLSSDLSSNYGEDYRKAREGAVAQISEAALLNSVRGNSGEWISKDKLHGQCVVSFREARKQAFYSILRNNPEFLPLFHPRASEAVAEYDRDFQTDYDVRLTKYREPNLQTFLMDVHRSSACPKPSNPKFKIALLEKFNEKLKEHASAPLLLSKMAAHAVTALNATRLSDPTEASGPVFDSFSPRDQQAIAAFLEEKNRALLEVVTQYQRTFQSVLHDPEFVSPKTVLRHFSIGYTECFLDQYAKFRACSPDEDQHPLQIPLLIAHRGAISKVFTDPDLHSGPLRALNRELDKTTEIGNYVRPAQDWVSRHFRK